MQLHSYYRNTPFHRNIRGFMVQGGDPTGTGKGGESCFGKDFEDEIKDNPHRHSERGILAMANRGPNTNGSQFFILYAPAPHLDGKHTVFGKVVGGKAVLGLMEAAKTGEKDKPIEPLLINEITVFANPFAPK
jgi:peptidyl-prolyl cis-trans isomerase-like protein 2